MALNLEDYNFALPKDLIALSPANPRDSSRLMVLNFPYSNIEHCIFNQLPNLLPAGCILVFNDTKVMPARLLAYRSGGIKVELLAVNKIDDKTFNAKVKPLGRLKKDEVIYVKPANLAIKLIDKISDMGVFMIISETVDFDSLLSNNGQVALPPYILKNRPPDFNSQPDKEHYQTVYAKNQSSIAAPTAGLHFTDNLLSHLKKFDIETVFITLNINLGTFDKVTAENISNAKLHSESFNISLSAATKINRALQTGRKIVSVGTTTARALESAFTNGQIKPGDSKTDMFIMPGFKFKVIDSIITNFHLPMSSLLVMISAFAGFDVVKQAYLTAVAHKYRFYSFGDAMLINSAGKAIF